MESNNFDVLLNISNYASLSDVDNLIDAFGKSLSLDSKNIIKDHRLNPLNLFSEITDYPEELMYMMMKSRVILSGSRAIDWFCPGSIRENSDWDFYGSSNTAFNLPFLLYMESIGVTWECNERDFLSNDYPLRYDILSGTLNKDHKKAKMQFIKMRGRYHTASAQITKFSSSISQCFISGFAAVIYYPQATFKGKSLRWGAMGKEHYENISFDEKSRAHVSKWRDRGIKYISYETHAVETNADNKFDVTGSLERERFIGDSQSLVIEFSRIYKDNKSRQALAEQYCSGLSTISWSECPYSLMPRIGITKFDDPPTPPIISEDTEEELSINLSRIRVWQLYYKDIYPSSIEIQDKAVQYLINNFLNIYNVEECFIYTHIQSRMSRYISWLIESGKVGNWIGEYFLDHDGNVENFYSVDRLGSFAAVPC